MQTTTQFLDAVMHKYDIRTDYQLAKFLNIRQQRISNYRNTITHFDEETCLIVADALDIDPGYVMACIAAERSKSEKARTQWARIAEKMAVAAVLVLAVTVIITVPEDFAAQKLNSAALLGFAAESGGSMYIMLNEIWPYISKYWAVFLALFLILRLSRPRKITGQNNEARHD